MTACNLSGVGCIDVNARCVWKGITLLFRTPQLNVLVDALRTLLSCFVELANAAPKFASCSSRTTAEDDLCPASQRWIQFEPRTAHNADW
jgi:hypothetical protein